jgi:nitrite reductase (NO-forming)
MVTVALLAGCGGGGGGSQPAGSTKVTMTEYSFSPSDITVANGKVVFYLVNAGGLSHDMVIKDKSSGSKVAASELISAGDSFVFTINSLPAGSYNFVCDQPGHEASGMKGTLTVT